MWLEGMVAAEDARPDKIGLVFSYLPNWHLLGGPHAGSFIIVCHEYWPGAADPGTPGGALLERITEDFLVQLVRPDGSAFLLPGWVRHPELDRGVEERLQDG
jgi:hypothetical protein